MKQKKLNDSTLELKKEIKRSFDAMIHDVIKGRLSTQEFTQKVNQNYALKKMELSGSLF